MKRKYRLFRRGWRIRSMKENHKEARSSSVNKENVTEKM